MSFASSCLFTSGLVCFLLSLILIGCGTNADSQEPVPPDSLVQLDTTVNPTEINPRRPIDELVRSPGDSLALLLEGLGYDDDRVITLAVREDLREAAAVPVDSIRVVSTQGIVTLTGTVSALLARERAAQVTKQIKGVRAVVNRIKVYSVERPDTVLRERIEDDFRRDSVLEPWDLEVRVEQGHVLLTGRVDSWFEKRRATEVAQDVEGIRGVENEVAIEPLERYDFEMEEEIEYALQWDSRLDEHAIDVEVTEGEAYLRGFVGSAYAQELASNKAWVNGIRKVNTDSLLVRWTAYETMHSHTASTTYDEHDIQRAIEAAWQADPRLDASRLVVEIKLDTAVLTGMVGSQRAKDAAAETAQNTVGVAHVVNNITLQR